MGLGTDIANRLDARHTLARERALLALVKQGQIVEMEWCPVPVSHRFHDGRVIKGTVWVAERAIRIGDCQDNFRFNVSHPTGQRVVDALKDIPKANAPDGAVLPTARIMDFAKKAATVKVAVCTQTPDAHMADTVRMLEHSRCVDASIAGRRGLSDTEGKGWLNTTRLNGHVELAANYGMYADGARYRSVDGLPIWQPGPGIKHTSGLLLRNGKIVLNQAVPQGFCDYSQVLEKVVRVMMRVEGRGMMSIHDVAKDPVLCWMISSEGPVSLRHPGVPEVGHEPVKAPDAHVVPFPVKPTLLTRTLRVGMVGQDVAFVQRVVGSKDDGIFGVKTSAKVKDWQAQHRYAGKVLSVDGVVGPRTRAAMLAAIAGQPVTDDHSDIYEDLEYDPAKAELMLARYFRRRNGKPVERDAVHVLLIHSAEAAEKPSTAEALGRYGMNMADGRFASWNWAFDDDSGVRCCPEEYIAYHAKTANSFSVGYEHAGYARQTRDEWLDDYSESMLAISAKTAARYTGPRWKIPLDNVLGVDEMRRLYHDYVAKGKTPPDELRGLASHDTASKALGGTHTDPGKDFPWDVYLRMIKEAA